MSLSPEALTGPVRTLPADPEQTPPQIPLMDRLATLLGPRLPVLTLDEQERALTMGELAEEMLALDALAAMDEGEWTETHEDLFRELVERMALKADSTARYMENISKGKLPRLRERAKELNALADRWEAHLDRLKSYIILSMERMDRFDIVGHEKRLHGQWESFQVEITDETVVPALVDDMFQRVIPEKVELDKVAIKQALELGIEVPFARLSRVRGLRIYNASPKPKKKVEKTKHAKLAAPAGDTPTETDE